MDNLRANLRTCEILINLEKGVSLLLDYNFIVIGINSVVNYYEMYYVFS